MRVLQKLNENQFKAVTSKNSTLLILAGAGAGKTTVLVHRVSYLHEIERVGCSSMLCLTFTRNAGKEMKERIIKLVGPDGKKVFCNTFHAFCISVLKEWGYLIGINKDFSIYDEDDKLDIIRTILIDLQIVSDAEKISKKDIESVLEYTSNPIYTNNCNIESKDYILAAKEYFYRLKQNSALDFDMLLTTTLNLLSSYEKVNKYYHNMYKYIFCDEFQDCNDIQVGIINKINPENLFVIGDDSQCIYGWRGAKPEYMINFEEDHPNCGVIKLVDNYRCTNPIIAAANNLISYNTKRIKKDLVAHKNGEVIELIEADNTFDECIIICSIMNNKLTSNSNKYSDFAILSRTNSQLNIFKEHFKNLKIPYQIINNSQDIFKINHVQQILDFVSAALTTSDNRLIKKLSNLFLTYEQILKLEMKCSEENKTFFEGLSSFKFKNQEKVDKFLNEIKNINKYILTNSSDALSVFNFVIDSLKIEETYKSQNLLSKIEDLKNARNKIASWISLQESLGESKSIDTFIKFIKIKDIQEKLLDQKEAVKLMTVHASKGLEFPVVFMIGINQNVFPNKKSSIEEERNLAYVGITRAKDKLFISRPVKIKYNSGLEVTMERSQFIDEMNLL